MKLLVTGGLGFIGSNFIRHLLKTRRGVRVTNLDLGTYAGNPKNLSDLASDPRYGWVNGDIADPQVVEECMEGQDAVVHFAAETHVDRSILDASVFLRTNVLGTQVLLDAALRCKTGRFVHVSTDEVYGSLPKGRSNEADKLEPNSPYAASKAAADLLARAYHVTHKLPVLITRSSNNFGPYQYPEKALPLMITNWIDDLPFPLYGDGLQVRDWLYVGDHARAIDLILSKGREGEIYNIGGTHSCTNRDLAGRVRRLMGKPEDLIRPVADRLGHDRRYALNCNKLLRLGFKHAFGFSEALGLTIAWYRSHESWWRPLKGQGSYKAYYRKQYGTRQALSGSKAKLP
jgi:dTDP-glucose 4,6-dehydratase